VPVWAVEEQAVLRRLASDVRISGLRVGEDIIGIRLRGIALHAQCEVTYGSGTLSPAEFVSKQRPTQWVFHVRPVQACLGLRKPRFSWSFFGGMEPWRRFHFHIHFQNWQIRFIGSDSADAQLDPSAEQRSCRFTDWGSFYQSTCALVGLLLREMRAAYEA
jgi:hypothetical protein